MQNRMLACGLAALLLTYAAPALAQKVKKVPFSYLPEPGPDRYSLRVPRKTLALTDGSGFIILAHQGSGEYAVERYDADLKKQWTTTVPVAPGETLEAFGRSAEQAWVVLHRADDNTQTLSVTPVRLAGGQRGAAKVLATAPARDRRLGVSISPDGRRLLALRSLTRDNQVTSMAATLFDQNLAQLEEKIYDFREFGDFISPAAHVANDGTQYVTLVSDQMRKLSVRRYLPGPNPEVRVLGVPVGGVYGGKAVRIRDPRFAVLADGSLYAAALCSDDATGAYTGLKVVKYDFTTGSGDMKFSPEVAFTTEYLAEIGRATGQPAPARIDDVYVGELLLTADKHLVVVCEKHYEEGGSASPVHARELHVFGYNEYGSPKWHNIIAKDQVAPAADGYAGIGFRAAAFGNDVQLLTQETLDKKPDLYLRHLNAQTGVVSTPERLKLNIAADQEQPYVKDFTAWLDAKTMIGVSRPNKKAKALQLEKIVVK